MQESQERARLADVSQPAICAGLLLILALVLGAPRAPSWVTVLAAGAAIAVVPVGVLALRRLRGAPRQGAFRFLLIATMVLAAVIAGGSIIQLLAWDSASAYLNCASTALTRAGRLACEHDLRSGLLRQLFGS